MSYRYLLGLSVLLISTISFADTYVGIPGGILSLNGLTSLSQSLITGTASSDFNITSTASTHTFNIPTSSSVNRGLLSPTDWTTFNAKQLALPAPADIHIYYVSVSGNDSTCDGSFGLQCATISKALSLITSSPQVQYVVSVGPGNYTDSFNLKPRTMIIGANHVSTRILLNTNITCVDAQFPTNAGLFGLANLTISTAGANPNINCNLAALGGTSSSTLWLENMQVGGTFTYSGRTDGDGLEVHGSNLFGAINIHGGYSLFVNSYMPTNVSFDETGVSDDGGLQLLSSFIDGNLTVASGAVATIFQSTATPVSGTLTINGAAVTASMDSVSSGSNLVLTSSPTVTGYTMGIALVNGASYSLNAPLVIRNGHIKSTQSTAPLAKVTPNAGTGASCSVANTTDTAGQLTLVTTATSPSSGVQCGINFNRAYNVAPICFLSSANNSASTLAVLSGVYVTSTVATMGLNFANSDVTGHTYVENFNCIETQ